MSFLFEDFMKYYYDHAGKSNALVTKSGSWQNPLMVGSMPTSLDQVSGIYVPYPDYICAMACVESYKDPSKRKTALDWQFSYDKAESTERMAIYVGNGLTQSVVISIRGTSDLLDIGTDILVAGSVTDISPRMNAQVAFINKTVRNYIDGGVDIDNIYVCGHSLGGLIAAYVHYAFVETTGIGFNIGVPPSARLPHEKGLEFDRKIHKMLESPTFKVYLMDGDPIASVARGLIDNEIIIKPNPPAKDQKQAHSMDFMLKNLKLQRPLTFTNPLTEYEKNLRYNFSRL